MERTRYKNKKIAVGILVVILCAVLLPVNVMKAWASGKDYHAARFDEYGKTAEGYYIYSDSAHRIKIGSCYFFCPLEPYRKQTLWYSTSKTGKAYPLYRADLDRGRDFGKIVFCNDRYIFFSAYDTEKSCSYIYRVTVATNKRTLVKAWKGSVLLPILKIYGNRLYYIEKPSYKIEEATTSYLNCIDLSDASFRSERVDQFVGNYNTAYLSSKRGGRYFWLAKVYGEHSRTDGYNGVEYEYSTYAIYDAKRGKLVRELDNHSYQEGASIHVAGRRIWIDREEKEQGVSVLAFYLCSEAGDQIEKIGEAKPGTDFQYQGYRGYEFCYSINESSSLQMDIHYYVFDIRTGKTRETTGKNAAAKFRVVFGPEK